MTRFNTDEKARYVQDIFTRIAPRYDLLNRLMTGGQDVYWRKEVVRRAGLHPHAALLDLGAGTGDLARAARAQQPTAHVTAADFTLAMMRAGRRSGDAFAWSVADALRLPFPDESFDAVVSGFLMRNVVDPVAALQEQRRVLRSPDPASGKAGGRIVILDTTRPGRNLFSPLIWLQLHLVIPLLGALISGQRDAYTYLPASTEAFLTAEALAGHLAALGFKRIAFKRLMLGTIAIHWAEKG